MRGPGPAATGVAAQPIAIRGLAKTYGDITALDAVDIDIASGEFLTLLGASGSGKTTLLLALAGFLRPSAGSIRFGEREVVGVPPHRRNVGMVFQNYALFPHLDVAGNVGFPLRLRRIPAIEREQRVRAALDLVQLGHCYARRIGELSGGQRQRVALARAVVFDPPILLMDEPLSALDKKLREQMQIELRHMHDRLGRTTVYVTHDQREALTLSDRVAVIDRGRIVQVDAPRDLYERPRSRFVAEFVGEAAFLEVTVRGGAASLNGRPLKLAQAPPAGRDPLWLVLRPEKLALVSDGAAAPHQNLFQGRVVDLVYQGESVLLRLKLDQGAEIALRAATRRDAIGALPAPGQSITLGLDAADSLVVPGVAPGGGAA